jgi:hypothetical protein
VAARLPGTEARHSWGGAKAQPALVEREEVGRGPCCATKVLRPGSSAWGISATWRGAKVMVPWELKLGYTNEAEKH